MFELSPEEREKRNQAYVEKTVASFFGTGRGKNEPFDALAREIAVRAYFDPGVKVDTSFTANLAAWVGKTGRPAGRESSDWGEADLICSPALALYIALHEHPSELEDRRPSILQFLTGLFWDIPDYILGVAEEKTNCTNYPTFNPVMPKTKEFILRYVAHQWQFRPRNTADERLSKEAFSFLQEALGNNDYIASRETHRDNQKLLEKQERYERPRSPRPIDKRRLVLAYDAELVRRVIQEHCMQAGLDDIRPWVSDDMPEVLLRIFQEALVRSCDRQTVLRILKEPAGGVSS